MKYFVALLLLFATPAAGQTVKVSALPAAAPLTGTEKVAVSQGSNCTTTGTPSCSTVAATVSQVSDYLAPIYQPKDVDLTAIAALTTQPFGRSLLTQSSASVTRTTLGLTIGADVQAYNAATLVGQTAAPTVSAGAGAGTGATVTQTFSPGGGTLTITTGSDSTSGSIANVTYASPYANRSHVVISGGNATSATVIGRNGYVTTSATGFAVSSINITPSSTIIVHYLVQGS